MYINQYTETKERSQKFSQYFDREKIMLTKGGKTYNLYDSIQAAREDTEIYPTLEKYGSLEKLENNPNLIYSDVSNALDLQGLYNQDLKLQEIFENLPSEERNVFGNDYYKFKEYGLEYYEKKAAGEIEAAQKFREEQINKIQKVEIVNDGGQK